MSNEKKERLKRLNKKNADLCSFNPNVKLLENKILSVGGDVVVLMNEDESEIHRIINRGQIIKSKGSILKKGQPSQCHSNSANLWEANKDKLFIVTGYALSLDDDGLEVWRCHTWCIFKDTQKVVETTVKRKLYFGYILNEDESEKFLWDNY